VRVNNKTTDDQTICRGIEQGGSERRHYENILYEKFVYMINDGIWKYKLTKDESSIAYSDTILSVIENIRKGQFEGRSGLKTYVFQIFSNKCVDFIRKNTTKKASVYQTDIISELVYQLPDDMQNAIQQLISVNEADRIRKALQLVGAKCYKLVMNWSEGYSDKEVAQMMDFNSAEVVKTSRKRCLNKVKELMGSL
jgi:RNA polymerase sigma factor (sigma-70 family)